MMEMSEQLRRAIGTNWELSSEISDEEFARMRVERYNAVIGDLKGYDCAECLNKGTVMYLAEDGREVTRLCRCNRIRDNLSHLENSGIRHMLEDCIFDRYIASEPWQQTIKEAAQRYVEDNCGKWFYIGGQVGCGKTHLCTAIVGELLKQGRSARYMLWRDDVVELKANVTDAEAYAGKMDDFKRTQVLYIDDFFKAVDGKVTPGDINVAFELLNHRYNNRKLVTIISSEKSVDEIMAIDEATGSRIYQCTKEYCFYIGRDANKNYRMR